MFPADDSNSFTIPYSDQYLLYSTLLEDADSDDYNHNSYPPFSFYDQNISTHPLFFSSDDHQLELQNSPILLQHIEEQNQPMLTAFEEFSMVDTSGGYGSTSMGAYRATENCQHNDLASDMTKGIGSTSAQIYDKVSKNVSLSSKDRHSKINTAQGPRDRRMRLSLDIAKRFFGLQDMLGFDKASKTIDWLLSKSQPDINKVAGSKTHEGGNIVATKSSSDSFGASECCEEVSEVVNKNVDVSQSGEIDTNYTVNKKKKKTKGNVSVPFRNGFNYNLAKESREKARARARKRTKEKMALCTWQNHNKQDENAFVVLGHPMSNQDKSLSHNFHRNPSSSSTFNNLQQHISGSTSHQLPFEDHLQFYAKPWETSYN